MSGALFACSKCYSRQPFEELSQGQQLCKECRGSFPIVKCTYCRSEFQQESKSSTAAVCKKCESMVKTYGKPTACDYCNIIAAFIGNKCQRCSNCEKKYGSPLLCQQCKQKCAFDRKDDDKKKTDLNGPDEVDGKLLCWLCTLSYKRALAKTKVTDPARHSHVKLASRQHQDREKNRIHGHNKRPNRPDVTKMPIEEPPHKKQRAVGPNRDNDPTSGDHLMMITQLREKIANMEKQLTAKDSQLIAKERQMTELKANQYTAETEMRAKMKNLTREHDARVDALKQKIKEQSREISVLNKTKTKGKIRNKNQGDRVGSIITSSGANASGTDGASSGTDSPSVN